MPKRIRRSKQSQLNPQQRKDIFRWLGVSERTKNFVEQAEGLLKIFSDHNFILQEELQHKKFEKIKELLRLCDLVASIIEKDPLKNDEPISHSTWERWVINDLVFDWMHENPMLLDRVKTEARLKNLASELRSLKSHITEISDYHLKRYAPSTKPRDVVLEHFGNNLMLSFQMTMNRLPVVSEKSDDVTALLIIYSAFGYEAADLIKELKKVVRVRREALGLAGRYKVKFGE